jgi:hypothetical protein
VVRFRGILHNLLHRTTTRTIFIIRRSTRAWERRPQHFTALFHRWTAIFLAPYQWSKVLGGVWATWLMATLAYTKMFSLVSLLRD